MGKKRKIAGGRVRKDDYKTSIDAAKKVERSLSKTQTAVYGVMKMYPDGLSDTQLRVEAMPKAGYPERAESTYRRRREELAVMGYVEDTGRTRNNGGGNPETVWRVTKTAPGEVPSPANSPTNVDDDVGDY